MGYTQRDKQPTPSTLCHSPHAKHPATGCWTYGDCYAVLGHHKHQVLVMLCTPRAKQVHSVTIIFDTGCFARDTHNMTSTPHQARCGVVGAGCTLCTQRDKHPTPSTLCQKLRAKYPDMGFLAWGDCHAVLGVKHPHQASRTKYTVLPRDKHPAQDAHSMISTPCQA